METNPQAQIPTIPPIPPLDNQRKESSPTPKSQKMPVETAKKKNWPKNFVILILLIAFILLISVGFNIYQYLKFGEEKNLLDNQATTLTQEKDQLNNQVNSLSQEKNQLSNQVSELNSNFDSLVSKTKAYLRAEGKIIIQGKICENEIEFCLINLTERLNSVIGTDCLTIADGVCPSWCAAGADVDCCIKKPGYTWIQGRGCYEAKSL